MISQEALTRAERKAWKIINSKRIVRDALIQASEKGQWRHREGRNLMQDTEVFSRGHWILTVAWSEGGRISSAGLNEAQIDPDTGKPKLQTDGQWRTFFRFGLTARSRDKREILMRILQTPEEGMRALVGELYVR